VLKRFTKSRYICDCRVGSAPAAPTAPLPAEPEEEVTFETKSFDYGKYALVSWASYSSSCKCLEIKKNSEPYNTHLYKFRQLLQ